LIDSLLHLGKYEETDFCHRLGNDLFPRLDGTPGAGPKWFY